MQMGKLSVMVLLAVLLAASTGVRAAEEKVALDRLPKAIVDAVKARFAEAKLVSAGKEDEDGKVVYEVALQNAGHKLDVTFTNEGKLVSIEKIISAKELPKSVSKALRKRYPKSSIRKIEEITKEDKVTGYEALLVTAEKETVEALFASNGKLLKEEKKEHKADKGEKK